MKQAGRFVRISRALWLGCTALLPLTCIAADPAQLEGTWKISTPQQSFRPTSGSIPFTVEGRRRYQENQRYLSKGQFDEFDYATARCASPGLPRLMLTPERFRIWQRSGSIMLQFEWNRLFRQIDMGTLLQPQIRLTAGGPPDASDEALVGRAVPISKGRWEEGTLVVTTEGFADNTLIDRLVPHGYDMKLTERIRLLDSNTLEDRITIEDPEYFTRPWETVVTYRRQADEAFAESVCLDSLPVSR
jgi:hypothetical protein